MADEKKEYNIPYTYPLKFPVQFGKDETVEEIMITRRLKAKDLKNLPASSSIKMEHMMQLVCKVTAKPMALIEEIDADDLMALTEVVSSFLPNGQKTGED